MRKAPASVNLRKLCSLQCFPYRIQTPCTHHALRRGISTEVLRQRRYPQPHSRSETATSAARFDDTFLLSEQVLRLLQRNKEEDATKLLARNSKLESTVSWNYLLNYHLRKGSVNHAMRIFNDMKRNRAFPNDLTYTTMLLGFYENYQNGGRDRVRPMLEALVNDSRVKPNNIHLNAVLKCTTLGKDLAAAGEYMTMMQDAGVTHFDSRTYTTLLLIYLRLLQDLDKRSTTSVRRFKSDKATGKSQASKGDEAAIREAKRLITEVKKIWQDVLSLARRGKLEIDDQLLSRYCYILVRGDKGDSETVVELVSQFCGLKSPLPTSSLSSNISKDLPKQDLKMHLELNLITPYWQAICQLGRSDHVKHCWTQMSQAIPREALTRPFYDVILTHMYGYSNRTFVMAAFDQMAANKVEFNDRTVWLGGRACSLHTSNGRASVTLQFYRQMAERFGREKVLSGVNVMTMIEMLGKVDPRDGRAKEYQQVDGVLRVVDGWDWVDNAKMMLEHRKLELAKKFEHRRDELEKITRKLIRRIRDQDKDATFLRNRAQAVLEQIEEAKANWPKADAIGRTTQPRDYEGRDKYGNRPRR